MRDLDTRGWLTGVPTFNSFVEAGNKEFNMFLWMLPAGDRAGDILPADSTIFTTLFGGDESLDTFWKNIATR